MVIEATPPRAANIASCIKISSPGDPAEGRINALAKVNALFVQSGWTGAGHHSLVLQELSPYRVDSNPRVRVRGPDLMLEPNKAMQSHCMSLRPTQQNTVVS